MNNFIILESEKNNERFIIKPIANGLLMLYRVKRHVVNGEMIDYKQLSEIEKQEKLRCVGNYVSYSTMPSEINFEYEERDVV